MQRRCSIRSRVELRSRCITVQESSEARIARFEGVTLVRQFAKSTLSRSAQLASRIFVVMKFRAGASEDSICKSEGSGHGPYQQVASGCLV